MSFNDTKALNFLKCYHYLVSNGTDLEEDTYFIEVLLAFGHRVRGFR